MSDASNKRLLRAYMEEASAPMFLSGFFRSPPENYHTTEKVEIDIMRDDRDVAIAIQDLSASGRENEANLYSSKAFTPPIFKEDGTITSYHQIGRQPGQSPFENPDYAENAMNEAFRIFRRMERKLRRTIEWMASQVLTTGTVTLVNESGDALYTIDFKPKSTHFDTVGVTWAADGTTGTPLADVEDLAEVLVNDGMEEPDTLIFGKTAIERFLANAQVKARLDNRRMELGQIRPQPRGQGSIYYGDMVTGSHRFELYAYGGRYRHPQTGNLTKYVGDDTVIMLSSKARLDLSFGALPMIRRPEERAMAFLPPRMSDGERGLDLTLNSWFTPDGEHLKVRAGTRPLTIPTAIDTFGALDITV